MVRFNAASICLASFTVMYKSKLTISQRIKREGVSKDVQNQLAKIGLVPWNIQARGDGGSDPVNWAGLVGGEKG